MGIFPINISYSLIVKRGGGEKHLGGGQSSKRKMLTIGRTILGICFQSSDHFPSAREGGKRIAFTRKGSLDWFPKIKKGRKAFPHVKRRVVVVWGGYGGLCILFSDREHKTPR